MPTISQMKMSNKSDLWIIIYDDMIYPAIIEGEQKARNRFETIKNRDAVLFKLQVAPKPNKIDEQGNLR